MGKRKIPGKRHRGVRDPLKQQELRNAKIKDHINNPPGKNHQKVSRSLSNFIKLKDDAKKGKVFKRKSGVEDKPKTPYKKIKHIKQLPEESDTHYLKRVNRITTESLKEAHYEAKYGVDVVRDPKTGEISIKKRPKDELLEIAKQSMRKGKKIIKKAEPIPKIPKDVIKELLKSEKKKNAEADMKEYQKDTFKFGEVVHAPPAMLTLPRKAERSDPVPRPGKKNNLILKEMLTPGKAEEATKKKRDDANTKSNQKTTTDLKGKRREMPLGTRLMLENEQSKAIELYKQLKKSKLRTRID